MRGTERLISVMDAVADSGPITLTELAASVGLPKPTVLRLLRALESGGWVSRDAESLYRTGPRVLALAHRYLDNEAVLRIASPHMLRLRDEVDETISLVVRSGDMRVCIQEFVSSEPLKVTHGVGSLAPLVESPASGVLLLAFSPASELRSIAADAQPASMLRGWMDEGVLKEQCRQIRDRGWVISAGGRGEGAAALTVPVHHPLTREAYALGVFSPQTRFARARSADDWIALMKRAASDIQHSLEGEATEPAVGVGAAGNEGVTE